jgi:hypothetical protein
MRLIGAPEALVEYNENIYLADQLRAIWSYVRNDSWIK